MYPFSSTIIASYLILSSWYSFTPLFIYPPSLLLSPSLHHVSVGIEWDSVPEQVPPKLLPYLPSSVKGEEGLRSDYVRKVLSTLLQSVSYVF